MTDLCKRSDLPPEFCAHCRGDRSIMEQAAMDAKILLESDPRWMPAQYPGTCGNCSERFERGDPIRLRLDRVSSPWIAACCAEAT